jgi:hypothetical protein
MMYHAIHLDAMVVVRPMTDGITNAEWFHGCRCIEHSLSEYKLNERLRTNPGLKILDAGAWKDFISSLDDPGIVPSNKFISTRITRDKWDTDRTIY